jgi:hypothetical protein
MAIWIDAWDESASNPIKAIILSVCQSVCLSFLISHVSLFLRTANARYAPVTCLKIERNVRGFMTFYVFTAMVSLYVKTWKRGCV